MNKSHLLEINGKKLKISDVEFLYFYENDNKEKFIVFEYCGEKYESKIENEQNK